MSSEITDLLAVAAEGSIGLAGFAGLVTAIRKPEEVRRTEAVMLTMIVWLSLTSFVISAIALALFGLDRDEDEIWKITSAIVATITFVGTAISAFGMRGSLLKTLRVNPLNALFWVVPISLCGLNVLNVIGVYFKHEPAPVFFVGLMSFTLTSYYFARLILDPVWAAVSERKKVPRTESADDA